MSISSRVFSGEHTCIKVGRFASVLFRPLLRPRLLAYQFCIMRIIEPTRLLLLFGARLIGGDFLGPTFPAPEDLCSDQSLVRSAWENVTLTFDSYLRHGEKSSVTIGIAGTENVTFSAGLFSVHDAAAAQLQYHYTAPQVASSVNGTNAVDGDSIYRVASVTKLMTVFVGMLSLTDDQWHRSIVEIVPEFASTGTETDNHVPEWDKITPWTLANHLSGIESTGVLADALLLLLEVSSAASLPLGDFLVTVGLPPVNLDALGPCAGAVCTPQDFVASIKSRPPVFPPNATPAYSNLGMMILGLAISRISNKPFEALYTDTVFAPLGMASSLVNAPSQPPLLDRSVVTGPWENGWLFAENGYALPSGGALSTLNDLHKLGVGILNSTLLPADKTRLWMKPHSHTPSFSYSVGAPWEIIRYTNPSTGKVTDLYTKLGDSGAYGGILVLAPDYGAGFSLLNAFYDPDPLLRGELALKLINEIAQTFIPALEAQAAAEAVTNYVGTYVSTDPAVNSSLVIAFNESTIPTSASGLSVQSFVSYGVDMLAEYFASEKPRLLLSIPKELPGAGKVGFQISVSPQWTSYEAAGLGPFTGFYQTNFDFSQYDGPRLAGGALRSFQFEVDERGFAVSVVNGATRLGMKREDV